MMDLTSVLRNLAAHLEQSSVPYAVMGGLAVRVYGIPRPTYDVDLTLAIGRERLPSLFDGLERLGLSVPDVYRQGWVDQVGGMPLVKARLFLEDDGVDVDFFLAESPFQQELIARRQRHAVDDFEVWLVSPEDLVLLKLIAARPRDIADVGDVLFMQGQLDEAYLRCWAGPLGVRERLDNALAGHLS